MSDQQRLDHYKIRDMLGHNHDEIIAIRKAGL